MDAVILAGGLGTRLAEALPHLPKALAPIQKVPFLQILLNQLQSWKIVSHVVLAVGHKASFIQEYVQNLDFVTCSLEKTQLGTGGALLQALQYVEGESVLVMNGDSFFDVPLPEFLFSHQNQKGVASIACHSLEDTSRYGSILLDETHKIHSFLEKAPSLGRGWINAGIYLIEKSALKSFPLVPCSLEKDLFPTLLQHGVYGYPHQGTFIDIGTPGSLMQAQTVLEQFT